MADTPPRGLLAAVVVGGVVVPGVMNHVLTRAGYPVAGTFVWVTGYLGMALLVWYAWIRPLDLTGP